MKEEHCGINSCYLHSEDASHVRWKVFCLAGLSGCASCHMKQPSSGCYKTWAVNIEATGWFHKVTGTFSTALKKAAVVLPKTFFYLGSLIEELF